MTMITLSPPEVRIVSSFTVRLRGGPIIDTSGVVQAISHALRSRLARNIAVSKDRVTFQGPGFGVPNWSLLALVDGGELTLNSNSEALEARFALRYTRSAILLTVGALLLATFAGLVGGLFMGLAALVFFELVVCIANLSLSVVRIRDFFEVTAHEAVRQSVPAA